MSFLGYGIAWKGCRDFMCVEFPYSNFTRSAEIVLCFSFSIFLCLPSCLVQQYAELRPAAPSEQGRGDRPEWLHFEGKYHQVHHKGSGSLEKLVDRGRFLGYEPVTTDEIKDAYVPSKTAMGPLS